MFPLGALLDPKHIDRISNVPQADRIEAETELRRLAKSAVDSTTAQMQLKVSTVKLCCKAKLFDASA